LIVLLQSSSARNRVPSPQDFCGLTSADSGLQLNLVIALSGVPANVQLLRLIQPCRRCVETVGWRNRGGFCLIRDSLSSF